MAQMAGAEKKETEMEKRPRRSLVILWNTVKRKEKRERERKVRKTGRQRQTRETRVKRDREDEKDHSPIWTLKISSFLFCSPSWVLESREEDGGYAVYTSASQPLLYVFTPQPHQKDSMPNKKWTQISSFSIIITIIMIFFKKLMQIQNLRWKSKNAEQLWSVRQVKVTAA